MAARATDRKLGPTPRRRERGPVRGSTGRRVWIDNLKVLLVTLIIAIHGVLGYAGTLEVWTYTEFREVTLSPVTEGILFVLVAPFGFFMIALLFLVAGLLTPGSVEHKGAGRFATDRLLRLGVPFALFVFLLQPTLAYALTHRLGEAKGSWTEEYLGAENRVDTGPLWFVGVLLIFSLAYAGWVAVRPPAMVAPAPTPLTFERLLVLTGAVVVTSFLIRLVYPYGSEAGVSDLNFWEWPACIVAFGLGVVTSRQGWLDGVPDRLRRQCRVLTVVALVAMAALLLGAGLSDRVEDGLGGWSWLAVAFALIEAPLTVCGPVWLLGVARDRLDRRYRGDALLNRTCYTAFIVQGFVLIGLAAALRQVSAPAEIKALLVAIGGVVGSFALAWLLVQVPGARRVL